MQHGIDLKNLPFLKIVASGIGYIVVDGRYPLGFDRASFAKAACDSKRGIGADYLIILEVSSTADYKIDCYSNEGAVSLPLEGVRVAAKFLKTLKVLGQEKRSVEFETLSSNYHTHIIGSGDKVRVDFGEPLFEEIEPEILGDEEKSEETTACFAEILENCIFAQFSNPHCVCFLKEIDTFDMEDCIKQLQAKVSLPKNCFIEFAQVLDPGNIRLRIWDPKVGEIFVHDEAVVAATAVGVHNEQLASVVRAKTLEDEFAVHCNDENIAFVGVTRICFQGEVDVESLLEDYSA